MLVNTYSQMLVFYREVGMWIQKIKLSLVYS